ncbi:MAG: phosphate ABC transporter, permease protein PstA, partial [Oscillospiraceae bacterium]|nr:phosphate ABC transporter, permease protein PstA [Oscillospiraceae bacterium]
MDIAEKSIICIHRRTVAQKLREYKGRPLSLVLKLLMIASTVISAGVLVMLIVYILIKGIPALIKFFPSIFAWEYTSENVSMTPAIVNTVIMTVISLVLAVPFGI